MGKWKFWLIGCGLIVAMVYLIASGIRATGVRYLQVHELDRADLSAFDNGVKLTGKVVEGRLRYQPREPLIDFVVEGPEGSTVRVLYRGIKPDAMRPGGHVIVEGTYNRSSDLIRARTLLAKCPSRYESKYTDAASSEK